MKKPLAKIRMLVLAVTLIGSLGASGTFVFAAASDDDPRPAFIRHINDGGAEFTDKQKLAIKEKGKKRLTQKLECGEITQDQYNLMINGASRMKIPLKIDMGNHLDLTKSQKEGIDSRIKTHLIQELEHGLITNEQYEQALSDISQGKMRFTSDGNQHFDDTELTDELKAEMKLKMMARLAQEMVDGKINTKQYNQMLQDIENGVMIMRYRPNGHFESL